MSLWQKPVTVEALNALAANTAIAHLGIEFTEVGADSVSYTHLTLPTSDLV